MAEAPKRGPGQPRKPDDQKRRPVLVSLSPQALALLPAGAGRSREIERLVMAEAERTAAR